MPPSRDFVMVQEEEEEEEEEEPTDAELQVRAHTKL